MTAPTPETALDAIRREIDVIDDQVLDLLGRRFAATRRVKATKASDGSIASSPLRPAREAALLRRLLARGGVVSPDIVLRLWRVILSASTQLQAQVTLHLDEALGNDLSTRLLLGEHFCAMQVQMHASPARALEALRTLRGDLAIVDPRSDWAQDFSPRDGGTARVIGTLPAISGGSQPRLLVFGHAEPQETGDDETLVLSRGEHPGLPSALWQAVAGGFTLTALPGFLSDSALLHDPISRLPGACIAGRCPRPFKVSR